MFCRHFYKDINDRDTINGATNRAIKRIFFNINIISLIGCADSMKGKVEQQEMELNVSNPRIFMEVQTASKEEVRRHRALYD